MRKISLCTCHVCSGNSVEVVNHGLGDRLVVSATDKFIADLDLSSAESSAYSWSRKSTLNHEAIRISHNKVSEGIHWSYTCRFIFMPYFIHTYVQPVKQVTWHNKGDYFATVSSDCKCIIIIILL